MLHRRCLGFILVFDENISVELKVEELELFEQLAVRKKLPFEQRFRTSSDLLFELRFLLLFKDGSRLNIAFEVFLIIEDEVHQLVNSLIHLA